MKMCNTCKHSRSYYHNHMWNEDFQKAYEEEIVYNEQLDKEKWYTFKPFPRRFWAEIKMAYDAEEAKKANYIVCKCMPTFVERKKDDLCGQWSA